MPLKTAVKTLNGSWQQLTDLDDVAPLQGVCIAERISLQPDSGNAGSIAVSMTNSTAMTAGGGEVIPAPAGSVIAPTVYESSKYFYQLNQFWVKGTNNDKLRINVWAI